MNTVQELINFVNEKGFEYTIIEGKNVVENSIIKLDEPKIAELKYIGYKPKRIVTEEVLLKGIVYRNNHGQLGSINTPYMNPKIKVLIYNGGMNIDLADFLDINLK